MINVGVDYDSHFPAGYEAGHTAGRLLLLGGKLGDLFGRKWTFVVLPSRRATRARTLAPGMNPPGASA